MKGCIYAILLLLCGMIHSAYLVTPTEGHCLFGNRYFNVGIYTARPCMRMTCDLNGQISFEGCPKVICNPGMKIIGYIPEKDGPSYPNCCSRPICKGSSKNS